jgi:hypothetical protein
MKDSFDYDSATRQIAEYEKRRPKNIVTVGRDTVALTIREGPDTASSYQRLEICLIPRRHGGSYKNAGKVTKMQRAKMT